MLCVFNFASCLPNVWPLQGLKKLKRKLYNVEHKNKARDSILTCMKLIAFNPHNVNFYSCTYMIMDFNSVPIT